jgi:Family of unknown function (DUF5996)
MTEPVRPWASLNYAEWSATCDTLHAHTQVLGKLAVALAPPERGRATVRPTISVAWKIRY